MLQSQLRKLPLYGISALIGVTAGALVTLFLLSLQWATSLRQTHPSLIWGLPLVGFFVPYLYRRYGFGSEKGLRFVLEEIHLPQQIIPWSMAPLIYLGTVLSHLVGASVGREGTALQMAASLADQWARQFKISLLNRRWALMAGLSAGFSAALGAPFAGALFGLEVLVAGRIARTAIIECFVASVFSWMASVALHAPHFSSLSLTTPTLSKEFVGVLLLLSLAMGLLSRTHLWLVHQFEKAFAMMDERWRSALGGVLMLLIFLLFPLDLYQGLGLETIRSAFTEVPPESAPLIKLLLTALALAAGFKGGEFIPLVFIGTTTASLIAHFTHQPLSFFAGLGFVGLFAAAAKTPWTCTILAIEYFGWEMAPSAIMVTWLGTLVAGPAGIYPGQRHAHQTV